ncbi:MAG: hypothetical protein E6Q97_30260 [Desulfurellales bacterium]|nr:MAG: hypothetical protein E6Q97_30260 [Desulfurellales bacterium]
MVKDVINADEIRSAAPEMRAKLLYQAIAPAMGWTTPKGPVQFKKSKGIGKDAQFAKAVLSDDTYIERREGGRTLKANKGGKNPLVQIVRTPMAPQVPSMFKMRINGESFEIAYGSAGELYENRATGKMERTFQAKPIMPSQSYGYEHGRPSCIEVNPQTDFAKFAYLMLSPLCSLSPLHLDHETKARIGLPIDWFDPGSKFTATMTPDFIDARQDRHDEIMAEDVALIAKINTMGAMELLDVCTNALVSVKGNPESPERHYKARLLEIITNKTKDKPHREKFEKIKLQIVGSVDIKDYEKTIKDALKLGILSHDGVMWTSAWDKKKLPWSIMNDETSGTIAVPGEEAAWFARKIVTDGMETWFETVDQKVGDAQAAKYEEIMGRGEGTNHDILEKAIISGVIVVYDKISKDKVHKWAIDMEPICDIKGWGNDNCLKTLKEHFKEMEPEALAKLVLSKTVAKS